MVDLPRAFTGLSTALVFDAGVRLRIPWRAAPKPLQSVSQQSHVVGQALPVRHYGSVDVFLEAIDSSRKGDVLVIDNGGRMDEACIGDLVALEAQAAELAGIVVWGCHRDTEELRRIPIPVFSCGSYPAAPTIVLPRPKDALESAAVGNFRVTREDVVFGDDDGVLFIPREHFDALLETARSIGETERRQAAHVREGKTLREQFRFKEYLDKRSSDSSYSLRRHLREIGGAVEE
jgi:4-hydroxy-4-methyl-2-oxoglutarate aldolase